MPRHQAVITGTGSYVPERILNNEELSRMVDTSDEWITTRTGMKERRIARADEFTSDMGVQAGRRALEAAGIQPEEVEMVLCATLTPDYVFPSTACLIQTQLGLTGAAALDIQAACSGYVYALSLAQAWIESGTYKTILLIASEKLSSIVNYRDRGTCILFGDGGAAAVLQADQKRGLVVQETCLGADGAHSELLILPGGGSRHPSTRETVEAELHYLRMEGKEVFKHAVRRMEQASKDCLDKMGLGEDQITWYVPHQANTRIIEAIAKRFHVPMERVYLTIHKYGNTSSSSLGIALDELLRADLVAQGENILITAFGAGLTWGASILTKQ